VSSQVANALARLYERSQSGKTGITSRDVLIPIEKLLTEAGASEGEAREMAERQLGHLQALGILKLEPVDKRDRSRIGRIRLSPKNEPQLYSHLNKPSPSLLRAAVANQFVKAAQTYVSDRWQRAWGTWCDRMREAAMQGLSISPFDRLPSVENEELLGLLPKLLNWQGESLVRFASCVLCGESKGLENLSQIDRDGEFSGKLRGTLGRLLAAITSGAIQTLDDVGIIPNPRFVLMHGPLKLQIDNQHLDFGILHGPFRLSQVDIERAAQITTSAVRCLTIENEASFHEIAKLQSGELLVQTSYPGSGTLALIERLPSTLEFWHFGDSDNAGFDILRVLRERSGRDFRPLFMERGRQPFEQESLGCPTRTTWPFYQSE
jgi:hypothetical protein